MAAAYTHESFKQRPARNRPLFGLGNAFLIFYGFYTLNTIITHLFPPTFALEILRCPKMHLRKWPKCWKFSPWWVLRVYKSLKWRLKADINFADGEIYYHLPPSHLNVVDLLRQGVVRVLPSASWRARAGADWPIGTPQNFPEEMMPDIEKTFLYSPYIIKFNLNLDFVSSVSRKLWL